MTTTSSLPSTKGRSTVGRAVENGISRMLGLTAATTDFTVTRNVRIPTRDGVELAADLYRPTEGAVGTLLVRGPYGRSLPLAFPMARVFAARGYNCLFVSSRGTFGSGGDFLPMLTEADDGHDVVAWMLDQPWFTGTFATLGGSYLGHTQWALLADPPTELVAAVISVGPHDFSKHAWGTGAFKLDFLGWSNQVVHQEDTGPVVGALRMALATNAKRVRGALDELPLVGPAKTLLEGRAPWYTDWVTRPDPEDPFWAPMQHGVALDRIDIPVLLFGGWQDIFLEQTIHQYRRLHDRGLDVAMTIGPWSHIEVGTKGLSITTQETFAWLEEHLAKRGGRRRQAPVHVFVTGTKQWRDLPSWPPETDRRSLYLHSDGRLSEEAPTADAAPSTFTFDPAHPTPTVGGSQLTGRCIVEDTTLSERPDVLTFTGPVLESPVEVLGAPVVELAHESDNPHADLFVRVSEVDPQGRSHNVTEGYLRLDPARTGELVTVTLRDAAHRFVAGSRLRLLIAGGSHPRYARNLGTDENPGTGTELRPATHSIAHGPDGVSRLLLPTSQV
jgi:putative CocE/NonD family hydrolase